MDIAHMFCDCALGVAVAVGTYSDTSMFQDIRKVADVDYKLLRVLIALAVESMAIPMRNRATMQNVAV